jgi:uncharacterized protein (UPF0147 family)
LLAAPDTPPEVVRFLAGTLADAGANAGAAVPGILKRLAASTDRRRRLLLAQAVDKIRPITGETVAQLARLAGTFGDDVEFRVQVVRTLGAAPAAAGPVGPLFTLMAAPDAEVAALAGQVLRDRAAAFAREDVPALAAAVHSPSQAAALLALQGLGTLGPDAASAVSDVRRAAGNSRAPVRLAAVTTLGKIGPAAKEAVADLLMHLKDENKELQLQAAVALVAIDPTAAKAAAPVLVRDRDRPEARAALIKAGRPAAERLAGALEFELRGATNAEARVQVINLLVEMGAAARYNQLLVLLSNLERSDPSSNVRSAARDARAKLQAARD